MITRRCYKCAQEKSISEFGKDRKEKLGHGYQCKACQADAQRARRLKRFGYAGKRSLVPVATSRPTVAQIAWAAGFLEGEGWFILKGNGCSTVGCCQVNEWPIILLVALFGGTVNRRQRPTRTQPQFVWEAYGPRARGVAQTVYPFMSPRRQEQIRKALGVPIDAQARSMGS